ncbi:MAG: UTP--glucose-1-phosphate uridylyltransferase GalU [Chloroflexi bacterium]|nr:UTP--glucose-1-phosphate uridylyltransferase GalU [Chloroflexota bacterium]
MQKHRQVRKAVITAAGWGTRFLPATKAQPKEMLPLVDKPMIQYVVEEAVAAGIEQLIIVTALGKRAIEDHFDRSLELEAALESRGDTRLLADVRRISDLADICYIRQKEQLGLGHAVLTARNLVGQEPFALLLPDDIIAGPVPVLSQLLEVYHRFGCSVVAVEQVARERLGSYGVISPRPIEKRVYRVQELIEKPDPADAPSDLGVVGRYVLTPEVFDAIVETPPGKGGEIQLTDGLRLLLQWQGIYACQFEGTRYDAGTPLGFLKASVELALAREDIGPALRQYLKGLDPL